MPVREYPAKTIGHIAYKVLCEDQEASVIGTTSRGIFIRTASGWITFFSLEGYRGPLTITLTETVDQLRFIKTDSPAQISSGKLILSSAGIAISAKDDVVWHHPIASHTARRVSERLDTLEYFAKEAVANKGGIGLSGILPPLLGLPITGYESQGQGSLLPTVSLLQQTLRIGNTSYAIELACSLLGMGRGLTPSGDDFVMGLLLVLNRWQNVLGFVNDLQQLNRRVIQAAYKQTTTLSANLIECAALGQSDERLVNVVDCIFTGKPRESECVSCLLELGASSGVDALVGMAVALTC